MIKILLCAALLNSCSSRNFSNDLGMEFVLIPGGEFLMGSKISPAEVGKAFPGRNSKLYEREHPQHRIKVNSFYMAKCETTVGQFRQFVQKTSYRSEAHKRGAKVMSPETEWRWVKKQDANWENPYYHQTDAHPVTCVTWNDARAFVDFLNNNCENLPSGWVYSLPSEEEWEYACRGGRNTIFPWGDTLENQALYSNCGISKKSWKPGLLSGTLPCGSLKPNAFGLYDMTGNLWEWCENTPRDYKSGKASDLGPKVLRGGAWAAPAYFYRSAFRYISKESLLNSNISFRLCLRKKK